MSLYKSDMTKDNLKNARPGGCLICTSTIEDFRCTWINLMRIYTIEKIAFSEHFPSSQRWLQIAGPGIINKMLLPPPWSLRHSELITD